LAVLYGNRAKDIKSFLKPICDELKELEKKPLRVFRNGEYITEANVYCLGVASDLMEASKLMNHSGHQGLYGCKWCKSKIHTSDFATRSVANKTFQIISYCLAEGQHAEDEGKPKSTICNMFGDLCTFNVHFQLMDEFHLFTNVARLINEVVSPPFNSKYKYNGNADTYPFLLKCRSYGPLIKQATDMSRAEIPPQFHASWKGINICDRLKGQYRSTDWINWLINIVPTLITPAFMDVDAATALNKLCHAVKLATQWTISEEQLTTIRNNIEAFFRFLDACLLQRRISKTLFRINLHMLSHIPEFIKAQGSLKAYSTRAMERKIGALKRVMNAARYAGENAGNIIEIENMLSFLQSSGIIDFDAPFATQSDPQSFRDYPSLDETKPQL
ncbi:hypothetical protein BDF20DRAFT_830676, partial [Mycotypha africana]|uniref:uncharacterized protein n=1 Tax=Mycotypha africana TaxID=64632 RepID=UPI0023001359